QAENFLNKNPDRVAGLYFINGLNPQIWVTCLEAYDHEQWVREYPEIRFFMVSDLSMEQKIYENDKLIFGEGSKEFRLPQQVKVLIFCQTGSGPLFLLLKRSPKANHFWQGITGAPFHGETWEESAIREVFEETEIKLSTARKLDAQYSFPMDARWLNLYRPATFFIYEQVYYGELSDPQKPQLSDEHEAYKWCTYIEAMSLLKWPNNKKALNVLASKLGVTEALTDKV
ncbi:MAG: NUDIX pyrophosphatase, partial [Pseudobdellovibrionaceae bacterium]